MAAFTHIGKTSRFTDGTFGVYYAASSQAAAIAETSYHQERFLAATNEPDIELTLRTYVNKVVKPLHDIRQNYPHLHNPDPTAYGPPRRSPANCAKPCRGGCFTTAFVCRAMNVSLRFGRRLCPFRSKGSTFVMCGVRAVGRSRLCLKSARCEPETEKPRLMRIAVHLGAGVHICGEGIYPRWAAKRPPSFQTD